MFKLDTVITGKVRTNISNTSLLCHRCHKTMLIDWLTLRLDEINLSHEQIAKLRVLGDRIVRFAAGTGELVYETQAWDSIRSDSHGLTIRMGSDSFWIQGSPARVLGDGCAVFGTDPASTLDINGCAKAMINYVSKQCGVILPNSDIWYCTRIDVTDNLLLNSQSDVIEALSILRGTQGGRYRVSSTAGDTVYWGGKSKRKKGKAYAKGAHLKYLMRLSEYQGRPYEQYEIEKANRLLRLELTIGSNLLRELDWRELTIDDLKKYHQDYFGKMIGDKEMTTDSELFEKLLEVCPTEGQAKAAFNFWAILNTKGYDYAKKYHTSRTFYRHLQNLRSTGLGDADISRGEITPLK